jgi:hypothetical protein
MSQVSAEVFLSLEASLALRLLTTYQGLISPIAAHMDKAALEGDWTKLEDLIDQIDLSPVFTLNQNYIRYVSNVAMLFGASRVTGESSETSAVSLGFEKDLIDQLLMSFNLMLTTTGEENIKKEALSFMAFLREPKTEEGAYLGKVLKFHNVPFNESAHPRVPAGSATGGEFTSSAPAGGWPMRLRPMAQAPRTAPEALNPVSVPEGTPEYGTPREGAVSVLGVHYSREPRAFLTGAHHGQGLKDAADERLIDADPSLKSRIYFYVDEGHGIVPESGVGGVKHVVMLRNMYDPQMDHGKVWSQGKGNANASEKAVLDAGYDGYYVRNFANQAGIAVLLGDHTVKVKAEVKKDDIETVDLEAGGLKTPDGNKPKKKRKDPAQAVEEFIAKFEPSPSVLPFSSFVDSAGRTFFNMASSLHTSRLSAFGYTAEAQYLGVTQYQIDEQLDGRTCPVCEYMNGKVFDVSDARGFLDTVVRTQDADELRLLQPWPSQSKAALATMKDMSSDELVMSGWHVPPFHPHCRGLLSAAVKASPTKQPEQQTEVPQQGTYAATAEDFNQLGVQLSPGKIEKWNQLMGQSPASVIASLQGKSEQELLAAATEAAQGEMNASPGNNKGKSKQDKLGIKQLTVDSHGRINIEIQRVLNSVGAEPPDEAVVDLYFNPDRNLFVGSVELSGTEFDKMYLGLKETLIDLYSTAQDTGMETIEAYAGSDMGGLALAKYGFAPSESGWEHLKEVISRRLKKTNIQSMFSAEEKDYFDALMASDDPKDIFALADMPDIASALLEDTTWQGFLDLTDPESMARFLTYLMDQ